MQSPVTTNYQYDDLGRMICQTDPKGRKTIYAYDAYNRITKLEHQNDEGITVGAIQQNSYDDISNKVQTTIYEVVDGEVPRDQYLFEYDGGGNLIKESRLWEGSLVPLTTTETDSRGLPIETRVYYGSGAEDYRRTSFAYDSMGRLIQTWINDDPTFTSITYNDAERSKIVTDENGNQMKYYYDPYGQLLETGELKGNDVVSLVSYKYDLAGNKIEESFYNDGDTEQRLRCSYGLGNKLIAEEYLDDEDLEAKTYEYDNRGNLIKVTGNKGLEINYIYDELDRMTKQELSDRTMINNLEEVEFMPSGNYSESVSQSYSYDELDQLIRKAQVFNGKELALSYAYDYKARLTSLTYPGTSDATKVDYKYDAWDRIISISGYVEGQNVDGSQEIMPGIEYDRAGFMQSIRYANGVKTNYIPDSRGRLQSIAVNEHPSLDLCYTYDGNNNIIMMNNIQYQYDSFNRLVEVIQGTDITNFSYDRQPVVIAEVFTCSHLEHSS